MLARAPFYVCAAHRARPRRRALAACERLVLLCGAQAPLERRDLAVLYMHVGRFRGGCTAAPFLSTKSAYPAASLRHMCTDPCVVRPVLAAWLVACCRLLRWLPCPAPALPCAACVCTLLLVARTAHVLPASCA